MRTRIAVAVVIVTSLLWGSIGMAQQHIVDPSSLRQAVATQAAVDQQNRDVVLNVLRHSQVREVASRLGLDVTRADAVIATMTSAELAEIATPARAVEADLAGGWDRTVVISLSTLLLILLVVILIAK